MNAIPNNETPKSKIQVLFERVLMAMVFACVFLQKPEGCFVNTYHYGQEVLEPVNIELMYNKERRLQIYTNRFKIIHDTSLPDGFVEIPLLEIPVLPLAPIPPYLPGQSLHPIEGGICKRRNRLRVA